MESESIGIWTIGHSTRGLEEFLALLAEHKIGVLADVRTFAGSRRFPHFGGPRLSDSLQERGIEYFHFPELGGRRKASPDSPNTAWRHAAFRGYADYMGTAAFGEGIERLMHLGRRKRTAIMCAEALWWRCHRSLIADCLKARGEKVVHIMGPNKTQEHPFTSAASIVDGELSYRASASRDQPKDLFEKK